MKTKATIIISLIIFSFAIYAGLILYLTWPISSFTLEKAAQLGDSFGILTSIFSGLAFAGMYIAVTIQHEELMNQRKLAIQNRRDSRESIKSQQINLHIKALNLLLNEYNDKIKEQEKIAINKYQNANTQISKERYIENYTKNFTNKKTSVITKLESIILNIEKENS